MNGKPPLANFDTRISVTNVLVVLLWIALFVYAYADLNSSVAHNSEKIASVNSCIVRNEIEQRERLDRLEARIVKSLDEIKADLRALRNK